MKHGGNIYQFAAQLACLPEDILDFSANINPEQSVDPSKLHINSLQSYADPEYTLLKQALAIRYPYPAGVDIEVFNGASAAIFALLRCLQPKSLVLYTPLYVEYAHIGRQIGSTIHNIDRFSFMMAEVPKHSTVIFVNPSTPDGQLYDMQVLLQHWQEASCHIIVDESFLDFCRADSVVEHISRYDKLYIIKSLSKFYGCAGVRIGFILASAYAINVLKRFEPAWKLSSFDMAYIQLALSNTAFIEQTIQKTLHRRTLLYQALQSFDAIEQIFPGHANFLLAQLRSEGNGHLLQERLAPFRILIRVCDNFTGLNNSFVRFAVKTDLDIEQLAQRLKEVN